MGAKDGEGGSTPDERPQHEVVFAEPFAIGRFTVTMNEWDTCVAAGGCSYRPDDQGWGRGKEPATSVLWDDAKEYVASLARITDRP
jgi:formylglycine-generating enzyme required for sulfatase activity